jgi:hypothetical protein
MTTNVPRMLRVMPHPDVGELPVPMDDGKRLTRAGAPEGGYLVEDSVYVRRRIMFKELVVLAEGDAALPKEVPPPAPAKAATPAALSAPVKE